MTLWDVASGHEIRTFSVPKVAERFSLVHGMTIVAIDHGVLHPPGSGSRKAGRESDGQGGRDRDLDEVRRIDE